MNILLFYYLLYIIILLISAQKPCLRIEISIYLVRQYIPSGPKGKNIMFPVMNTYREGDGEWDGDYLWNLGRLLNHQSVATKI